MKQGEMPVVYTYAIQNTGIGSVTLLLTLVAIGAAVLLLAFRRGRDSSVKGHFLAVLIIGIVLIGLGIGLYYAFSAPTRISVSSSGFLGVQSSSYFRAGEHKHHFK